MLQRLLLHERTHEGGTLERTWLEVESDELALVIEPGHASKDGVSAGGVSAGGVSADEASLDDGPSGERRSEASSTAPYSLRAPVPFAFLDGIMQRYGKELDDSVARGGPRVEVAGRTLGMLRYRPLYDVIAKDYFVYAHGAATPRVELATSVTAALVYLVRKAAEGAADD